MNWHFLYLFFNHIDYRVKILNKNNYESLIDIYYI